MVAIWEMDPYPIGDPRLPHHVYPPKMLTPDELFKRTGVNVWKVNMNDPVALGKRLTTLKLDKNFQKEDIYIVDEKTCQGNFAEKLETLFEQTAYEDEEARMVMDGEAYYDIEHEGAWIRVFCEPGDLLNIPKHRLHRLTTTPKNYIKMKRLSKLESS